MCEGGECANIMSSPICTVIADLKTIGNFPASNALKQRWICAV